MKIHQQGSAVRPPRLLPVTIVAMAGLLVVKSTQLVFAATAAAASLAPAPSSKAATVTSPKSVNAGSAAPASPKIPEAVSPSSPTSEQPALSEAERSLLVDLRARRHALDEREAALAARERVMAAVNQRLSARLDELSALQARLETLERQRKEHDESNWHGLVKLYEVMKPRDAATIFNDLDPAVLLPVLDRMKESKAAPILSAMLPDRARQATAELARMRANANTIAAAPGLTAKSGSSR